MVSERASVCLIAFSFSWLTGPVSMGAEGELCKGYRFWHGELAPCKELTSCYCHLTVCVQTSTSTTIKLLCNKMFNIAVDQPHAVTKCNPFIHLVKIWWNPRLADLSKWIIYFWIYLGFSVFTWHDFPLFVFRPTSTQWASSTET